MDGRYSQKPKRRADEPDLLWLRLHCGYGRFLCQDYPRSQEGEKDSLRDISQSSPCKVKLSGDEAELIVKGRGLYDAGVYQRRGFGWRGYLAIDKHRKLGTVYFTACDKAYYWKPSKVKTGLIAASSTLKYKISTTEWSFEGFNDVWNWRST